MKEHKIGETFQYQNVVLEVVECKNHLCDDCYFYNGEFCVVQTEYKSLEPCTAVSRKDKTNIRFKQVNKVDMNKNLDLTKILDSCPVGTKFYSVFFGEVEFYKIEAEKVRFKCEDNFFVSIFKNGLYFNNYKGECTVFPAKDQRDWSKFERFWDKPKKEYFDLKTLQAFDKVLVRDFKEQEWTISLFSHISVEDETDVYYYATINNVCWKRVIPYNDDTKHLVGTKDEAPEYYRYWED